eukprot:Lithocolla_globosa_v1_NODE_4093_length_1512_cov_867.723404.p2 type:complete len:244 gc:universal NODE_4093_length_1512_cov_867.723404:197-928(+)
MSLRRKRKKKKKSYVPFLDQISNMHRHFFHSRVVVLFNITEHSHVVVCHKVDGNTLATESTTTTNSVNIVFSVSWQIVVDDQRHLLDINTTRKQIGGDQHTGRTGTELLHDDVALFLVHFSMHGGHSKLAALHFFCQVVDLSSGVAENNSLCNCECFVEIAEGVEFPIFTLDSNVKLLDTFKGQFVALDQNTDGIAHKALGHFQYFGWHGGRQQHNLNTSGDQLENFVNDFIETTRQHLISLV